MPEGALEAALEEDPGRPGYLDSGFRLVLAVNKADLLPSVVTRTRLEVGLTRRTVTITPTPTPPLATT